VRAFRDVLAVDEAAGTLDAEGMVTYEDLVEACLARGVMPAVVPQLKTITLGGALAGVGIEASSHRHGLVHDTALEIEVLLGDGRIVTCTPDNEHADLFFGFPNSYGTLGYALRVKAKAVPVQPYVRIEHLPFADAERFFAALGERLRAGDADFIDGTVFSPQRMFLTLGRFAAAAPYTSDYTYERIYYRSIAERREDYLTVRDFIWRWDTDWFWCSKNVGAQNPLLRRLAYGRKRLGSRTYTRIMRWNSRVGLTKKLARLAGLHSESVIQDVDIPLERAAEFLEFYAREIGLWPQWTCPIGPAPHSGAFTLYPMRAGWYVNFGFWDVKRTREAHPRGHFNRLIEEKVNALGGIKSLYSESFFPEDEFRRIYGGEAYAALKRKYDPQGAFPGLYEKCVLRR
jgi:FAD/FMN-containing dehydrogenase